MKTGSLVMPNRFASASRRASMRAVSSGSGSPPAPPFGPAGKLADGGFGPAPQRHPRRPVGHFAARQAAGAGDSPRPNTTNAMSAGHAEASFNGNFGSGIGSAPSTWSVQKWQSRQ